MGRRVKKLHSFQLLVRSSGNQTSVTASGISSKLQHQPLRLSLIHISYTDIARELEAHAGEELAHAIKIAKQIDYLGGMPGVTPKPVKTSSDPVAMLSADLENERVTVGRYRERCLLYTSRCV